MDEATESDGCFDMFSFRRGIAAGLSSDSPDFVKRNDAIPSAPPISAEEYPMNHKRRGKAIVFNHETFMGSSAPPRRGSDRDVAAIKNQFEAMGFQVDVHKDKRRGEITAVLEAEARDKDADIDCLVVFVMTHGDLNQLQAYDTSYRSNKLWETFTADRCPALAGKPKLFFLQACRGRGVDQGTRVAVSYTQTDSGPRAFYTIPTWADMLIANATFEGHFAFRSDNGSVYIQALCQELARSGSSQEICKILTRVNRQVAISFASYMPQDPKKNNSKQMPNFLSTLTRDLYFRPKTLKDVSQPSTNHI